MKSLFIILALMVLAIECVVDVDHHWCHSCDDPHLQTFDQRTYEFQYSGDNYILFTNYNDIKVTTSYRPCSSGYSSPTCNCGVHVKYRSTEIYLDTCGIAASAANMEFFYTTTGSSLANANCNANTIPAGFEFNPASWIGFGPNSEIQCAVSSYSPDTYYIRTGDLNDNRNIYVRVNVYPGGISCVEIRPPADIYGQDVNQVGGLCGSYNDNSADDLSIWHGGLTDEDGMHKFWQEKRNNPADPTAPFLYLDDQECPCDPANFWTPLEDCPTLVAECIANELGLAPVTHQSFIHSYGKGGRGKRQADPSQTCNDAFKSGLINEAAKAGLISGEWLKNLNTWCIKDTEGTGGDPLWALNLAQFGQNQAKQACALKREPTEVCNVINKQSFVCANLAAYQELLPASAEHFAKQCGKRK